jgi:uncharacterized protein (TIGR02301 family)
MVPAMPAIRTCIAVSLALCFAAGPAWAQFWGDNWNNNSGNGWRSGGGSLHHRVRAAAHKQRAHTSESPKSESPKSESPKAAVQDTPLPYDHNLERLSEILGALHFLRGVCNSGEGEKWRSEAKALIDAEAPSGNRREHMVASFNRGYSGFESYRSCTPAADIVIRRYMEEGAKIARDLTARYAN